MIPHELILLFLFSWFLLICLNRLFFLCPGSLRVELHAHMDPRSESTNLKNQDDYRLTLFSARRYVGMRWFQSPIDANGQLYRHSDATPMELFFDLFFVANLSTFTATHEINNVEGMLWILSGIVLF